MLITFCVPTLPGRESLLSRCLHSITEQAAGHSVDILVVAGTGKLGDKVNAGVVEARGEWFTVVDDDDWLSACYLDTVAPMCADDPDYIGLKVLEMYDGKYSGTAITSGESTTWTGPVRLPVPKGVTRTTIARQATFANHYTADREWSQQVSDRVRTWRFVDRVLYHYDYYEAGSAYTGDGGVRFVGWWPYDKSMVRQIVVDR